MTFDVARGTQPYVLLHMVEQPRVEEAYGLSGSHVIGDETYDDGFWHQPSPADARSVAREERVLVEAYLDDGDPPICLGSITVDAAPFSPLAADPTPVSLVPLSEAMGSDATTPSLSFAAPTEPGDWVVRVAISFDTTPGPSRAETFFRLFVDVPPPAVDGTAGAPVACGELGGPYDPPLALLSVDGGPWIEGKGGSFSWRGVAGDGPAPNGPRVEAPQHARARIMIEGDQCANWWRVQLAPRPPDHGYGPQEPITDLVPDAMRSYYDSRGEANRFQLAEIPPGDWIVRAFFAFGRGPNHMLGSTTNFWNVVVE